MIVDAGAKKGSELRDDRFKNPSQVYQEAMELQKKLEASKKEAEAYQAVMTFQLLPIAPNSLKVSHTKALQFYHILSKEEKQYPFQFLFINA